MIGFGAFLLKGGLYGESTRDGYGADDCNVAQAGMVFSAYCPRVAHSSRDGGSIDDGPTGGDIDVSEITGPDEDVRAEIDSPRLATAIARCTIRAQQHP